MGDALYDMKGLTYQGHLHQFWTASFRPDMKLLGKFREYLLETTQINAVFYGGNALITNKAVLSSDREKILLIQRNISQ